jgi:hypothetical protein
VTAIAMHPDGGKFQGQHWRHSVFPQVAEHYNRD